MSAGLHARPVYVLVAGAGEVGRSIAKVLRSQGHDIVVVDRSAEALEPVRRLDVLAIEGGAGSPAVLKQAGVEKADLVYGVTDDDEANFVVCALAKARNPKARTIARVNGLDYMREPLSEEFAPIGCDVAVCPELVAARRVAGLLDIPMLLDADVFAQGRVQVVEARVHPGSAAAGKKLKDLPLPPRCKLAAVFREDEVLVPGGEDALRGDDRVLAVLSEEGAVARLQELVGDGSILAARAPVRRVLVVGATRVGVHLARVLAGSKEVTLIERSRERCEEVTDELRGVLVIQGDAADKETLEEEGIESVDAMVACDERDEFNILTCLLAKQLGVRRVVSLVRQGDLKSTAERIGIDLAISPRQASIGAFLRYAHEQVPVKLYLLGEGRAQVLEVEVAPRGRLVGTAVRKAGFPRGSILGAIVRGKEVIVPGGNDHIQAGDRLVVFALTDVAPRLQRLL